MIAKMPNIVESLEYFRNWDIYDNILKSFEKVNYYFCDLIKEWLCVSKSLSCNPTEYHIISCLINNSQNLENILNNFELHVGKDILVDFMNELRGANSPEYVYTKLKSINSEIQVLVELKKTSSRIHKLKEIGDWETEDKIISVKSILELDLNHQLIENVLSSLFYIKEYDIIRKYSSIRIEKGTNIDYPFRNSLLNYLRNNIINDLNVSDSLNLKYPEIGETTNFISNDLIISICTYVPFKERTIKVDFTSQTCPNSKIIINFSKDEDFKGLYSINNDTNSYWIDEETQNEDKLLKYIKVKISEINNNYNKYKQKLNNNKSFEGWIVLPVHPQDHNHILNDNEFVNKVKMIKRDNNYKIFLFAIPQMNFDSFENQIFEI